MPREGGSAEAFQEFLDLWAQFLSEGSRPGTTVVVEGERDRRSIRRLGWRGGIAVVHRGRTIGATAQALVEENRRIVVLTDWDSEGGTFARRLREFLSAERVELDLEYRRRLARLLRGELAHVEGLYGWVRRNAERYRIPIETIVDGDAGPAPTG